MAAAGPSASSRKDNGIAPMVDAPKETNGGSKMLERESAKPDLWGTFMFDPKWSEIKRFSCSSNSESLSSELASIMAMSASALINL